MCGVAGAVAARCCFAAARRGQQQLDRCALDSRRTPPTTQQQVEAMAHVVGARGVLLPRASTPECTSAAATTPHFRRGPQLAAACELTAPRHWDCRWHPLHPLPLPPWFPRGRKRITSAQHPKFFVTPKMKVSETNTIISLTLLLRARNSSVKDIKVWFQGTCFLP